MNVGVPVERGQDQDFTQRKIAPYALGRFPSVYVRHFQIHQDHIGPQTAWPIADADEAAANYLVIVDHEN